MNIHFMYKNTVCSINAPKTLERLEEISTSNALDEATEEDEEKIRIHEESIDLFVIGERSATWSG